MTDETTALGSDKPAADEATNDLERAERRAELRRIEARRSIEAVVLVAQDPIEPAQLAELTGLSAGEIEDICEELTDWYESHDRGFQLARVAGGYRYQTHSDQAEVVRRFVLDGQSAKLSAAALETLSIVAYKQPISRAQVSAIRGVGVDAVMRTLQQRGYIEEIARDPGPGQAVLYGTTRAFLEKMGIDHLDELPALGAFVPAPEVLEALEAGLRIEETSAENPVAPGDTRPIGAVPDISPAASADLVKATSHPEGPEDLVIDLDQITDSEPSADEVADVIDLRTRHRSTPAH